MEAVQNTGHELNTMLEQLLAWRLSESAEPPSAQKSSLQRLIKNCRHIERLFSKRADLKSLRFNELDLLRDIRELVESDPRQFDAITDPIQFRRQLRASILPKYVTNEYIRQTQEKIINVLLNPSLDVHDQDALMTAMVFLQSHTDLGIEYQDNPLWEIIFNLSIQDGIRFVDSLTALIEGLDSLREENPDLIQQEPFLLQKTMQIAQWPILWRKLANYRKNEQPFDALSSALLRGQLIIELYFDEVIHLPMLLYRQFKDVLSNNDFFLEQLLEEEQDEISSQFIEHLLTGIKQDKPVFLPVLLKQLHALKENITDKALLTDLELFLKQCEADPDDETLQIIFLTLLIAKVSIRKYWDNKRDFLYFVTVLRDPENPYSYFDFGHILLKLKQVDSIEQVFRCAMDVAPDSFWGYWGLGQFYLKQNELDASEKALDTALKIAQQQEIKRPGQFRREVFLIKDDIKKLKQKKVKVEAKKHEQIDLFG